MALPVDFMERVVEWPGPSGPGFINAHWQAPPEKGPGMRGKPFKDLHEFMDFVQYASTKPGTYKEIFFCLSTQAETGKVVHNRVTAQRHASKAIALKAIWLDVDVKPDQPQKCYTTLVAALDAINKFVSDADLPTPSALVFSGGGVHVYWLSPDKLTHAQWLPYAEGLKAEAIRLGLKCDAGITADAARVLRVPGTFNNKIKGMPRPVKLAHLGASYDFAADPKLTALAAKAPAAAVTAAVTRQAQQTPVALPPAFANGPAKAFASLDPADTLGSGLSRGASDLPLDPAELFKGCHHFRDSFTAHGAGQSQGLWMLTGLASTWLDEGRKIFHTLSKGYPTYSPDETDKMFDRKLTERASENLGWPSCHAFEGEGAKCQGCPFRNKIRSPLHLCERVAAPPPPPPTIQQQVIAEELDLPDGYTVNDKGLICEVVEKVLKDETTVTEHIPLFLSKLRGFKAQGGAKRLFLFETSLDAQRWGPAQLDEAADLINDITVTKALRGCGVKPNTAMPNNGRRIITFMTTFMAKLDAAKERQQTISFGWLRKDNGGLLPVGFAYGGELVMNTGERRVAGYSDMQLEQFYKPKGEPEPWWDLLHMVTEQKHPALEALIAASFGAPLQFATGQYNGVFSAWSPESGAHKSTSIAIGAAVWGSPKLTKEKPLSSPKGVIRKIGYLKNLPIYWDEINSPKKMDEVQTILSVVTEGAGGSKLQSDRKLFEYEEWQTMLMIGSNRSLVQTVLRNVKDTDAQLERVYEIQVEKRLDTRKHFEVDAMVNALDYNYGHVGMMYRDYLGTHITEVKKLVTANLDKFVLEVTADSKERFRCAIAMAVYTGAQLANEIGCDFHLDDLWAYLRGEFLRQRSLIYTSNVVAGTAMNVLNTYTQFIKSVSDNVLHVATLPAKRTGQQDASVYIAGPNRQRPRPVHVRMCVSERCIDISKTEFTDWLEEQKQVPSIFFDGLRRHWGMVEIARTNLAIGSGLPGGAREPAIRIPVPPGSPFEQDVFAPVPVDQWPPDYKGPNPVTAAVTPTAPAGLAAASAQATQDLNLVRSAT